MQNSQVLSDALRFRYATKKFDSSRKISKEIIEKLEEALVLSASSYGLQPWKFLFINDSEVRKKLRPVSWNQPQVEDASHYVVLCAKTSMDEAYVDRFINRIVEVRGTPKEILKDYRGMMLGSIQGPLKDRIQEWASRQVYIALGTLLTASAVLGVDACPMEGFDSKEYDKILNLGSEGFTSVVCCALGYRSAEDPYSKLKKVRFSNTELVKTI